MGLSMSLLRFGVNEVEELQESFFFTYNHFDNSF